MSLPSHTGSLASLRLDNRMRVIDVLRRRGAVSRAQIARDAGISRTTVGSLVSDLIADGFVTERAGKKAVGYGFDASCFSNSSVSNRPVTSYCEVARRGSEVGLSPTAKARCCCTNSRCAAVNAGCRAIGAGGFRRRTYRNRVGT